MMKIRIGNNVSIRWQVTTNGEVTPLSGRNLALMLSIGSLQPFPLDFSVIDTNVIAATYHGIDQRYVGVYSLTLWEDYGTEAQSVVDHCDAFELVPCSCDEESADDLSDSSIEVTSNLVIGIAGLSAYEVAVKNGFEGDETEWLASLKEPAESAASEVKKEAADAIDEVRKKSAEAIDVTLEQSNAAIEAVQTEANTAIDAATANLLKLLGTILPSALSVEPVPRLFLGSTSPVFINAVLSPEGVRQNIIFISDNKAVTVDPDGRLRIVGSGRSVVQVIPTINTALAKIIEVEVVEPIARLANTCSCFRLTASGAFRMD